MTKTISGQLAIDAKGTLTQDQLDQEISRLRAALSARQEDGRPLSHSVMTAYKSQILRCEAARADLQGQPED